MTGWRDRSRPGNHNSMGSHGNGPAFVGHMLHEWRPRGRSELMAPDIVRIAIDTVFSIDEVEVHATHNDCAFMEHHSPENCN